MVHTHVNRKVIGSSRVEDHVSRCAIQDVYELNQFSQVPAMQCDPLSQVSHKSLSACQYRGLVHC